MSGPMKVVSLKSAPKCFHIEAEQVTFVAVDPSELNDEPIVIEGRKWDANFRALHDSIHGGRDDERD